MLYFLLICFIFILAFSLFSIIRTIRNINKQIKQQRKIRVSLSNRDIEELAYAINQKDNLHKKLQVQIKQEEEQLKQSISNIPLLQGLPHSRILHRAPLRLRDTPLME